MGETKEKLLPGTASAYVERGEKGFSKIGMLLDATGGLSLSQVCAVTGLESSTIQNWVKRGWVAHPEGKKYEEVHIARILIVNALKECIKLEHIALLMSFVNGPPGDQGAGIIKESELYNFLCDALEQMGQANDSSRGGAENVVETVIKDYTGPKPDSRARVRKALTLMIFACVCTDVKRRTEAMMEQILLDLKHPERFEALAAEPAQATVAQETATQEAQKKNAGLTGVGPADAKPVDVTPIEAKPDEAAIAAAAHKTVSQALREWDFSSVERVIIEADDDTKGDVKPSGEAEKNANRPWYLRRGTK